jgi:hypothetical protein
MLQNTPERHEPVGLAVALTPQGRVQDQDRQDQSKLKVVTPKAEISRQSRKAAGSETPLNTTFRQ